MQTNSALSRRQLLERSAIAAAIAAASTHAQAWAAPGEANVKLEPNSVVLFQGDSITDAGRDRRQQGKANAARGMGSGYPMLIGCELLRDYPQQSLQIYNRGISGHKVPDLAARWTKDCLDLKPAVLSVLIGVNDIWHKLNGRYDGTVEQYQEGFLKLLQQTREALPETTLVVCEPFVLRCGAVKDNWFPEFDQRREAAAQVAKEMKTLWVPFQSMFDAAVEAGVEPNYWAGDGVHPSMAGHSLMAKTWKQVVLGS